MSTTGLSEPEILRERSPHALYRLLVAFENTPGPSNPKPDGITTGLPTAKIQRLSKDNEITFNNSKKKA